MRKFWQQYVLLIIGVLVLTTALPAAAQEQGEADQALPPRLYIPLAMGSAATLTAADQASMTDQLIIRFAPAVQAAATDRVAQVEALSAAAGVELAYGREMSGEAIVLRLPQRMGGSELQGVIDRLAEVEEIELVEPDAIMQTLATPDDPRYPEQWHYAAPTAGNYGANLPAAWDITIGSTSVVVAVVDTGIINHSDLNGRTVAGYDFISDSRIANDGNGRDTNPADVGDWITATESASGFFAGCQVRNSSWHGAHVAGTIAANSNNGIGGAGINWNAKILPVRVLGKCGGYTSDIVDGIRWSAGLSVTGVPANANKAKVINMSLGGSGACSSTYQTAINEAVNAGTVVVVAAGNSNADAANYSPASCANVITVASTGKAGSRAYYSNFGTVVEIAAPGGDKNADANITILSTIDVGLTTPAGEGYAFYQGTSMATPHVAGVASLLFSVNPNLTPAQVTSLLQSNVTPFPIGSTCNTTNCGTGILNAQAAVVAAQNPPPPPAPGAFNKSSPANGATRIRANTVNLQWGASSNAVSYQYCIDTSNNNTCNATWIGVGAATSVRPTGLARGVTYYWQVQAINAAGTTVANGGSWWNFRTR
jgi:serine protease